MTVTFDDMKLLDALTCKCGSKWFYTSRDVDVFLCAKCRAIYKPGGEEIPYAKDPSGSTVVRFPGIGPKNVIRDYDGGLNGE